MDDLSYFVTIQGPRTVQVDDGATGGGDSDLCNDYNFFNVRDQHWIILTDYPKTT